MAPASLTELMVTSSTVGPMVPTPCVVADRSRETSDVVTLTLDVEDLDTPLPSPGQFAMLWAFGAGEVPISLSGIEPGRWRVTIRAVGAATEALTEARQGSVIGVRGPFGTPWPLEEARGRDVVLVAGGLGLAPIRPALEALLVDRESFGRIALLVGARAPEALLFRSELQAWRARLDLDVEVTVDHAPTSWRGDVGIVTKLINRCVFDPANTVALLCGPEIMMRFAASALSDVGVPPARTSLSLERSMSCAVAHCGRCQLGPTLLCRDGPVVGYDVAASLMAVHEL